MTPLPHQQLYPEPPYPEIDEAALAALVADFYGRARHDPLLGPVFMRAVGEEAKAWDAHIARVADFWSSVLLGTRRYQGRPMVAHARQPEMGPAHFARWLTLFEQTARARFSAEAAAHLAAAAGRIGRSLQAGLALARGQ